MQRTKDILPPTVMDQIRLWEYEGERMEATVGWIMKDFSGPNEYRELLAYAENLGVLVWNDEGRREFFVDRLDQITAYLKRKAKPRE
jgi:transcription initiation factor TFIIH subunit 4